MTTKLFSYQKEVLSQLRSGSILVGGVGSGKSITALAYFYIQEGGGSFTPKTKMTNPKTLYVITTARKRDTKEWEEEVSKLGLVNDISMVVDSWNNIQKYIDVEDSFFIFDEQRLVGHGTWVKSFFKISKENRWILLSATPGDTWMDYIPVFIANGFYKNRTQFLREHVIFNRFVKYPKVDRYVNVYQLIRFRKQILVYMDYKKETKQNHEYVKMDYDKLKYDDVMQTRWDPFKHEPIKNATALFYIWRKIVNSDPTRLKEVLKIQKAEKKVIVFYNFNYELVLLRHLAIENDIPYAEWNGHKHQQIPKTDGWLYLVQYTAGAEGWNCTETDTMIFYSQNYSYKIMHQAAGRIDRLNTPYTDLYFYHLVSEAPIDRGIKRALSQKKNFNEVDFLKGDSRQVHML